MAAKKKRGRRGYRYELRNNGKKGKDKLWWTAFICIDNGFVLDTSQVHKAKRDAVNPARNFANYCHRLSGGKIKIEIKEV